MTLDAGTAASMPGGGLCPAANGVAGDGAAGAGWMDTGVASPKTLTACAQTEASTVKLFPMTGTAPQGLIQMETQDVIARCAISGSTGTATISGKVSVRWLTDQPVDVLGMDGGDSERHDRHGCPSRPDDAACQRQEDRRLHRKLDGIRRCGSGGPNQPTPDGARVTSARVPAALTLDTVAMRNLADGTPDPDTAVKVTVGRALCAATDRR